jgi:hypothetical protein
LSTIELYELITADILFLLEHGLAAFVFPPLKSGKVEPFPRLEVCKLHQHRFIMRTLNFDLEKDRFAVLLNPYPSFGR